MHVVLLCVLVGGANVIHADSSTTIDIFTKTGNLMGFNPALVVVNNTQLSYGVGVFLATIFFGAALWENGLLTTATKMRDTQNNKRRKHEEQR